MRTHVLQEWTVRCGVLAGAMLLGSAFIGASFGLGTVNVLERGYNKFRTGANTAETVLTPAKCPVEREPVS